MDRDDRVQIAAGETITVSGLAHKLIGFERPEDRQFLGMIAVLDDGNSLTKMPVRELLAAIESNDEFDDDLPAADTDLFLLADLSDKERASIGALIADLRRVMTGSPTRDPDADRAAGMLDPRYDPLATTQGERIKALVSDRKIRGEKGTSPSTVKRQLKTLREEGPEGFVHGNRRRFAGRIDAVDPEIVEIARNTIAKERELANISDRALCVKVRAALVSAGKTEQISVYKLKQIVGEASRSERTHMDSRSKENHFNKPDRLYGSMTYSRPGEVVQVDATDTTIHVFDRNSGWVKAVILTAIDAFTRCILGLRVVVGKPCSRDVCMLIWDIGRPVITRSGAPFELAYYHGVPRLVGIQNAVHRVIGEKPALTPSTVLFDNGKENGSVHLYTAAAAAGVEIVFCPPKAAYVKGIVESWHNGLDGIQSLLAGYKGQNPQNHPKGVEDRAIITAHDLHDILWEWVLTVYHHTPHGGLKAFHGRDVTPAQEYQSYLASGGHIEVMNDPWRIMNFMSTKQVLVQDYGLNIENRTYNSAELRAMRSFFQRGAGARPRKVTVYFDRYDVSRVYLRHPATGAWLRIPQTGSGIGVLMPHSEMMEKLVHYHVKRDSPHRLTEAEAQHILALIHNKYGQDGALDSHIRHVAAIETFRASQYAVDLADASPEFLELAFGPEGGVESGVSRAVTVGDPDANQFFDLDAFGDDSGDFVL